MVYTDRFSYVSGETFSSELRSRNQAKILGTARESATYRNIIENNFERRVNFCKTVIHVL